MTDAAPKKFSPWDPPRPTTYFQIQQARDPSSEVPRQLENSPWHHDPVPPEPPLGEVGLACGATFRRGVGRRGRPIQ